MSVFSKQRNNGDPGKRKCMFYWLIALMIVGSSVSGSCLAADRQNLFDWYYSAVFGTGAYRIGERDVFVVTLPSEDTWREATQDKYEVVYSLPVTIGFYDYNTESIVDLEIPTDVATLIFLPGFYYNIALSENWSIKPFANIGYGKEFAGGEEAWIYSGGVRSLYRIRDDEWRMSLGSALYYAGNTRESKTALGFAALEVALDINHATDWRIDDKNIYLGGYAAVYLFSSLEFVQSDQTTLELNEQYELGITVSTKGNINLLGMELERIGLAYLTSSGFRAWRLVFSFPY
jgi:hypothetical protein